MLQLHYINPTGFFSFGYCSDIMLDQSGLVNLVGVNEDTGGDSNGAGKSSLFNALCEILYGDNPTNVSGAAVENQVWQKGFAGRVEFTAWENIRYRVTYCRDWKDDLYTVDNNTQTAYKKTGLFFDKYEGNAWIDSRYASMADTRKAILKALGVSYNRFLSISYLSHRMGSKFLRGANEERVDILAGIAGIEEWDDVLSRSRAKKNSLQAEIYAIQEKIAYEKGALEEQRKRLAENEATDWKEKAQYYQSQVDVKAQEVEKFKISIELQSKQIEELSAQQQDVYEKSGIGKLSQEVADLVMREKGLRGVTNLEKDLPQFDPVLEQAVYGKKSEVDTKKGELHAFCKHGDIRNFDKCPTCGTAITKTKKDRIQKQITDLQEEINKLVQEQQEASNVWQQHRDKLQKDRAEAYELRQKEANAVLEAVQLKQQQMAQSNSEFEQVVEKIRQLSLSIENGRRNQSRVQEEFLSLKYWVEQANSNIQVAEVLKKDIESKKLSISKMEVGIADTLTDMEILTWLIQNIPFIKLHKLSVVMTSLSAQVNKYLADMGDTVKVNISSFEAKKVVKDAADAKDFLKSKIKVEVIDGEKNIDPRLYSDGETSKISNAIIRALHDLAMQSGHGCNVIFLDEIFAFVDLNNSQKLIESFKSFLSGTSIVTDNSGYVSNLLDFNETWTVTKQNGLSTVEVRA